jgi:hypothetical protein
MIPFFRKIRKKMADDNKPMKYMRYAIGEIALVVIGILIAISINNWNEAKTNQKIVDDYLDKISVNINSDLKKLETLIDQRTEALTLCDTIVMYYDAKNIFNPKLFEKGFFSIFIESRFNPNTNAYESLKSSGFMKNLKNSKIEDKLSSYYYLMDGVMFVEDKFNNSTQISEASLSEKGFYIEYKKAMNWNNKDTINFNYESLKKYPQIESEFIKARMFLEELIKNYSVLWEEGNKVIELINKG